MSDYVRIPWKSGEGYLTGVPRALAEAHDPSITKLRDVADSLGIAGNEDFTELQKRLPPPLRAQASPTVEDEIRIEEDVASAGEEGGKWDLLGSLGALARGGAPAALGALIGLPFGPIGSAAGVLAMMLSDLGVVAVNGIFGTDFQTPSEAIGKLLTNAGVAEADHKGEQLLQMVSQAVTTQGATSAIGAFTQGPLTLGQNFLQQFGIGESAGAVQPTTLNPSGLQTFASQLAYNPSTQMAGAAVGTVTGEGARAGVQSLAKDPDNPSLGNQTLQAIAGFFGSMAGDALVSPVVAGFENRATARSLDVPERNQDLINRVESAQPDIPVTTAEALLADNPTQVEANKILRQLHSEQSGLADTLQQRSQRIQRGILEESSNKGVVVDPDWGLVNSEDVPLMHIYNKNRSDLLTKYVDAENEALSGMAGYIVDTTATQELIGSIQEDLLDFYPEGFKAFSKTLDDINEAIGKTPRGAPDADLPGDSPPILKTLDVERAHEWLSIIGSMRKDDLIPQGVRGRIDRELDRLYDSLRNDIGNSIEQNVGVEARNQWATANQNQRMLLQDFKDTPLSTMINQAAERPLDRQTISAIQQVIKPGADPVQFGAFWGTLSPGGKELATTAVYAKMLEMANPLNAGDPLIGEWAKAAQAYKPILDVMNVPGSEADQFLRDTVGLINRIGRVDEALTRGGTPAQRLDMNQRLATAGIVLSQATRKLGILGGIFLGDVLQNGFGAIAKAYQRPEVRDMILALRSIDPGTAAEGQMLKRILRAAYSTEMRALATQEQDRSGAQPEQAPEQAPEPETTRYRWR